MLHFLVCDSQSQNQQAEILKKGVNGGNNQKKMGVSHTTGSLITKLLD